MKRVSEIEGEPQVGKFYMVPCLINGGTRIPVLGPEHEDKEYIGFERPHYHFDLRFLPDKKIANRVGYLYERERKPICSPEEFMMLVVTIEVFGAHEIAECPVKCRRRMPVFPLENGVSVLHWFSALEAAFADKKLNCARCPHRGFPLSAENADENGVVVCPGHGLAWNIQTGEMVGRLKSVGA
jgi:Rieske [2Fe-2S] domain